MNLTTELEFLNSLWGLGTGEEEGYRTGTPGYIGWRNSFLGIDSEAPNTFKNTGSDLLDSHPHDRHVAVFVTYMFWGGKGRGAILFYAEVGRSATCSAMRISATCATRKFAADVRFNLQAAEYGIAPAH
jgi:hypothetical protein